MTVFTDMERCYSDYRPRYPRELLEDLRRRTVGERGERLVDWACGTGELAIPLSPFFDRVTAIDAHEPMMPIARENARRAGASNVEWVAGRAEDLEIEPESCDLITVGSAFHSLDQELLAGLAFAGLKPGAALALAGGGGGGGVWNQTEEWHEAAAACVRKHATRAKPPAIGGSGAGGRSRDQGKSLSEAGFEVESFDYPAEYSWRADEVIGYLYAVSFAPILAFGDGYPDFERDLRAALDRANPSGIFEVTLSFQLTIGRKPRAGGEDPASRPTRLA